MDRKSNRLVLEWHGGVGVGVCGGGGGGGVGPSDAKMFIPESLRSSCMIEPDVTSYLQTPSSGQVLVPIILLPTNYYHYYYRRLSKSHM